MAKAKQIANERRYVIPLRREILKVSRHKRTPKAVKAVKQFLVKHMRIPNRDINKIKLDDFLNKELWHRGIRNPPTKIEVKTKRDGDTIRVTLAELPERFKFEQNRKDKKAKAFEKSKKKSDKSKEKTDSPKKSEDQLESSSSLNMDGKKEEFEEKDASIEIKQKRAKVKAKTQKHVQSRKEQKARPMRKALQK